MNSRKGLVTIKQTPSTLAYHDLSKKDRKLLRYIVRHTGEKGLKDIEKKFGVYAEKRLFYLFNNNLVVFENNSEDDANAIDIIRPTKLGEDFDDAIRERNWSYWLDRIVIPLLASILGGLMVWILSAWFTPSVVTNNTVPSPSPSYASPIDTMPTNTSIPTPTISIQVSPKSIP